jgi:hypothetical protein
MTVHDETVQFEVGMLQLSYEGKLSSDGKTITGTESSSGDKQAIRGKITARGFTLRCQFRQFLSAHTRQSLALILSSC